MLSDSPQLGFSAQNIGWEKTTSLKNVVSFVENKLASFNPSIQIRNEKGLTQDLYSYLNSDYIPFSFEKEYMINKESGQSPSVDIGVLFKSKRECFFQIETKILGTLDKKREKEYLVGRFENGKYKNTGGVERFKKEIHGVEIRNGLKEYLTHSALIAYVAIHDFDYWHSKINSWIESFINMHNNLEIKWDISDKLIKQNHSANLANVVRYFSVNSRKEADSITLFHLWVILPSNIL